MTLAGEVRIEIDLPQRLHGVGFKEKALTCHVSALEFFFFSNYSSLRMSLVTSS
jgi:hypothetical protein